MAMWRSGARTASRHFGRQYDRGYQFRYPTRLELILGPWDSVWPFHDRDIPKNVLSSLMDGVLKDGVIFPLWAREESSVVDPLSVWTVAGSEEVSIGSTRYGITVSRAPSSDVKIDFNNELGVSGTDTFTYHLPPGGTVDMAAWQQVVYMVQPGWAEVKKYSPIAHTLTAVAGSPLDGKYIFILNNNLVVIRKNGAIYEAVWSVDSLPEDFTGAGSGAAVFPNIGEIRGVGVLTDRALIIGSAGAIVMVPTGGLPAFAFQEVTAIPGTPYDNAVTQSHDTIFYYGYDRKLYGYSDGGIRQLGVGEAVIVDDPRMFYSKRLGLLVVTLPTASKTLFLDVNTGKWVADLDRAWHYFSDQPAAHKAGRVFGFFNTSSGYDLSTMDLDPLNPTLPRVVIGNLDLQEEWTITHVDIHRTNVDSPVPLKLDLELRTQFDALILKRFGPGFSTDVREIGHHLRYYVGLPALSINLTISAEEAAVFNAGPFMMSQLSAGGNPTVDPSNPPSGQRGDLELTGNLEVSPSASEYFATQISNGNLLLQTLVQVAWPLNTGIDRVEISLKKQGLEEVQRA